MKWFTLSTSKYVWRDNMCLAITFSSLVNWLPLSSRVFEKSLQYVKRFSRYKNPDAVRQAREYPPTCGL